MTIKLLVSWDIAPEHDQEYYEFVVGEWIPGVQRMGLEPTEAWLTMYGEYPQIQVALLASDLPEAQRVLNSPDWTRLRDQLFTFVKNYSYKVVPARAGFQF